MNEALKVKVEERAAGENETRRHRAGNFMPLKHTAEINPFFEGVFRRYLNNDK
jgi:hypothetical protein